MQLVCEQDVQFAKLLEEFTVEVIAKCFIGDSTFVLGTLLSDLRTFVAGLFSIPRRLPWPLSRTPLARLPALNFGRASDARDRMAATLKEVISARRSEVAAAAGSASGGARRQAVLDTLLSMQAEQQNNGGAAEGEIVLDDAFIVDNVSP